MDDDKSELEKEVQSSFDRDAVCDAIMNLALTCEPDGMYDPVDDPRPEAAVLALADLLGNASTRDAAMGVQLALWKIIGKPY